MLLVNVSSQQQTVIKIETKQPTNLQILSAMLLMLAALRCAPNLLNCNCFRLSFLFCFFRNYFDTKKKRKVLKDKIQQLDFRFVIWNICFVVVYSKNKIKMEIIKLQK